jgi:hypothetical protein
MFADEGGMATAHSPPWCVTAHDPSRGEDDWLHMSEPVVVAEGVVARLVMSVDPQTGEQDGPYVMVGDDQLTPSEAQRRGFELSALAALALRPPDPDAGA